MPKREDLRQHTYCAKYCFGKQTAKAFPLFIFVSFTLLSQLTLFISLILRFHKDFT